MATTKTAGQRPAKAAINLSSEVVSDQASSEPPIDIPDARDTVKRQPIAKHSGRVVKARPTHGGVVIEMRPEDWANVGIPDHKLVRWDFLQNKFQVPIEELSDEALAYLLEHDSNRFKVVEPTE